jgi:hypothetical protein
MSIEEQVRDALSDFRSMVSEGLAVEEAISTAAIENGIKPDVLRQRLERSKPLDEIVAAIRDDLSRGGRNRLIFATIARFCTIQRSWIERSPSIRARMMALLESDLGEPPSTIDQAFADKTYKRLRDEEIEAFFAQHGLY